MTPKGSLIMRKQMLIAVMLVIFVSMVACGRDDDSELRIAIVTNITGIDDMSFNQNNYEGIQAFIRANPDISVSVTHVHEPSNAPGAAMQAVENVAGDFDVIVLPGFQFRNIGEIAVNNPETYFLLIDVWPEEFQGRSEFPNVRALSFAEQEAGFLAGVVAALESETGRVAFIGGEAFPAVVNYQFGFESGLHYANAVFGTDVHVVELPHRAGTDVRGINIGGNYVGTFYNTNDGNTISNELLSEGVDIIFVAAGGTGIEVHKAVRAYAGQARIIGVDTDQFDGLLPPGENVQITAVYKAMGLNVHRSLITIADGSFEGGNHIMRTDTNSVGIVLTPGRHQLPTETINRVNQLFALLRDGDIVPASNFNGYTPDNFPGMPGCCS